jgi:rhamnose transport system ATP-binding protein
MSSARPAAHDETPRGSRTLLSLRGISKSFGGVRALREVDLDLCAGEVHALVGENGAGKSTLIRVITGAHAPDSGVLEVLGRRVESYSPRAALALGIAVIYQQPKLFGELSVAENLLIGTDGPLIPWRERHRRARGLCDAVGLHVDTRVPAKSLSLAEQQLVEIARALRSETPVLVLDEPTAVLPRVEAEHLLEGVSHLRARGAGILYITHRLDEVMRIADRVSVLRDGERVWSSAMQGVTQAVLVHHMVGRELEVSPRISGARARERSSVLALEVRGLSSRAAGLADISFELRAGEVLGLAGLVGAGRSDLAACLFGLAPFNTGDASDACEVRVHGKKVELADVSAALAAGLAFVPADRQRQGVIPPLTVAENLALAQLDRLSRRGIVDARAEHDLARHWIDALHVKTESAGARVDTLSGGNQQKVVLARWLAREPRVLILDEPTQGIDVAGRAEIHRLIREHAARGLAVLLISSDLPELLALSDRVAVMRRGRIAGILAREDATQEEVLALALGIEHVA